MKAVYRTPQLGRMPASVVCYPGYRVEQPIFGESYTVKGDANHVY